jgi:hypothetical protein
MGFAHLYGSPHRKPILEYLQIKNRQASQKLKTPEIYPPH